MKLAVVTLILLLCTIGIVAPLLARPPEAKANMWMTPCPLTPKNLPPLPASDV